MTLAHLTDIDELLALLASIHTRLAAVETTLATCPFGSWSGQAARAAKEERHEIVTKMNTLHEILNAAESNIEDCRTELILSAAALS